MKILITDSKGDSISITIGDNGSFRELDKSLEKGNKRGLNSADSQNDGTTGESDRNIPTNCLPSMNVTDSIICIEKSNNVDAVNNSNLQLLEEQVKSCLNQIQMKPGKESSVLDSDIEVSISSSNENEILKSKSFCRLCATRAKDMVHMFDTNKWYTNIIEKIEDCLPIVVTKTDTLPKEACRSCLNKLELCHEFHRTVAEAEKRFLILGGKISYDSEKTKKYCQTISRDCRTRSSSTGEENIEVTFDGASASEAIPCYSYSAPNSPLCALDSGEESSFEENISRLNTNELSSGMKKARKNEDDVSFEEGAEEIPLADCNTIRCEICGKGFQTVKKCQTHSKTHMRDNYYPCGLCDEIFTLEKDWSEHCMEHKQSRSKKMDKRPESYICEACGKKFVTEARLEFHKIYHDKNSKPCYCEICDKTLDSESTLYQHLRTVHQQCKGFRCHICGKQFRVQASVNAHQRKHRYVRSFECNICNKRFYSKDTLEMHKETHSKSFRSDVKNFLCSYCGKSFTQKSALALHIMNHGEIGESDHCENNVKVNKEMRTEKGGNNHRKSDPADRPFRCTVCGRTFDHSARLREHSSVHTGKRPYSCSLCDKSFKRANARKVHMIIHTGEKPYQCNTCGTNFRRAGDMRRHKKTQHGQNE